MKVDVLVVGAGFAGSVIAERCASAGKDVLVIDKREHIAGNAFDHEDKHGVLIHKYGPHIFHTNSANIAEYLSRFTEWRPYEHRVLAQVNQELYPIPINRTTINQLYRLDLNEAQVAEFFERIRIPKDSIRTSEDVVLSSVGADLCEKFFRGYTRKQWGLDLSQLSASVAARIPVRTNSDDRYFSDTFQKMPSEGYTRMFERMLDHPKIRVELACDFAKYKGYPIADMVFYTGPIDEYFDYQFGRLPYRSLRFEHEHFASIGQYQPVGTVNYPNDFEFTRITEFRHLTGQKHQATSIVREYPQAKGDPYYPIPRNENQELYQRYVALASKLKNTFFVGRLAQYRYYNMDQVVAAALKAAERVLGVEP